MPQAIYIIIAIISTVIAISQHGKPRKGNHNAWTTILSVIITTLIISAGGFFV